MNNMIEFEICEYASIGNENNWIKRIINKIVKSWFPNNMEIIELTRKMTIYAPDIKCVMQHRGEGLRIHSNMCVIQVNGDEYVVKGSYSKTLKKLYETPKAGYKS